MEAENRANFSLARDQALRCPNCNSDAIARKGKTYFCLDCDHVLGSNQMEEREQDYASTISKTDSVPHFIQMETSDISPVAPDDHHNGAHGIFAMGTPGTPVQPISRSPEEEEKAR